MAPVEIEGKLLVVDISTPLLTRDELDSTPGIIEQLSEILTQRGCQMQLRSLVSEDTLVVPDLADITSGDFSRGIEIVAIGA